MFPRLHDNQGYHFSNIEKWERGTIVSTIIYTQVLGAVFSYLPYVFLTNKFDGNSFAQHLLCWTHASDLMQNGVDIPGNVLTRDQSKL